jgi:hypothetical protein
VDWIQLKTAVFWVESPCSQKFTDVSVVLVATIIRVMSKPRVRNRFLIYISETLVNFYQTTQRYHPKDSHLHTRHHENLKSYNDSTGSVESSCEHGDELSAFIKYREYLDYLNDYQLLKKDCSP